jgi:hypothetical protein
MRRLLFTLWTLAIGLWTASAQPAGAIDYYVAYWGNDANNGTNPLTPFATPLAAVNAATVPGDVIHIMAGINSNGIAAGIPMQLSPGVGWDQDPASLIVISNTVSDDISHAWFRPNSNCHIRNLRMLFLDSLGDNDVPIGIGGQDLGIAVTNCIFDNLYLKSGGIGIHFEGIGLTAGYDITFNNPYVYANDCCYEQKNIQHAFIKVNSPTFIVTNWSTASIVNGKPLRVVENAGGTGSYCVFNGGTFTYSDTINCTNFGGFNLAFCDAIYSTNTTLQQSNMMFNGVTLNPQVMTNANSADVSGVTNNMVFFKGVVRVDGKALVQTNPVFAYKGSSIINLDQNLGSAFVLNPIVSGGYWTNTNSFTGSLTINLSLSDAVSGAPGMNMTNIITGEWNNATSSIAAAGIVPATAVFRMQPGEYVIVTNKSSGSASASVQSSSFRP